MNAASTEPKETSCEFTCQKLGEPVTARYVVAEHADDCAACEYVQEYFPCAAGDEVFVEVRAVADGILAVPVIRRVAVVAARPVLVLACVEVTREEAMTVLAELENT